ncbi:MAG: excisionase family DNA-binding protein [Aquabacterium sp.]|uniref:excisionase family DNA-binding protein n=1 Tax=Aquabacterium sp. TaxID=1872578 RepID=UPI0025C53101|nr:excisionase family DNA-binding protein [Aquabacterium sp.]MBI3382785.1 excisionase family DNA-binding protein [Aquabacterium sp.]
MSQVIPLGPAARMLTTREAAVRLGVSLRTVQLWVEANILPAARTPGGHRRIPYNAVEALALSTGLGGEPVPRSALNRHNERPLLDDAPVPSLPELGRSGAPMDVLLVADDQDWQARCAQAMEPYGAAVKLRFAETGYLALLQIGQKVPDLLITNLELPGMDGMAMLRTLERCESIANMRILALTDSGEHELARRGGLPRSAEVMRLPVTAEAVAVRVGRWLLGQRVS